MNKLIISILDPETLNIIRLNFQEILKYHSNVTQLCHTLSVDLTMLEFQIKNAAVLFTRITVFSLNRNHFV